MSDVYFEINIDAWKSSVEYRIEANNQGLEIPGNVKYITEIINIVRLLELLTRKQSTKVPTKSKKIL
jgi:hypothetical protein